MRKSAAVNLVRIAELVSRFSDAEHMRLGFLSVSADSHSLAVALTWSEERLIVSDALAVPSADEKGLVKYPLIHASMFRRGSTGNAMEQVAMNGWWGDGVVP
jgi:hypothetical protein